MWKSKYFEVLCWNIAADWIGIGKKPLTATAMAYEIINPAIEHVCGQRSSNEFGISLYVLDKSRRRKAWNELILITRETERAKFDEKKKKKKKRRNRSFRVDKENIVILQVSLSLKKLVSFKMGFLYEIKRL